MKSLVYLIVLLIVVDAYLSASALAQTTYTVTGLVTNARTGEPVPFASVALIGKQAGTVADENGRYKLVVPRLTDSLAISSMGYAVLRQFIDAERESQAVDIRLIPTGRSLEEVTIHAGENPAFRILREVRNHKSSNDRSRLSAYESDTYTKTQIALSHVSAKMSGNPLMKRVKEGMRTGDSLIDDEGNRLLPCCFPSPYPGTISGPAPTPNAKIFGRLAFRAWPLTMRD